MPDVICTSEIFISYLSILYVHVACTFYSVSTLCVRLSPLCTSYRNLNFLFTKAVVLSRTSNDRKFIRMLHQHSAPPLHRHLVNSFQCFRPECLGRFLRGVRIIAEPFRWLCYDTVRYFHRLQPSVNGSRRPCRLSSAGMSGRAILALVSFASGRVSLPPHDSSV